ELPHHLVGLDAVRGVPAAGVAVLAGPRVAAAEHGDVRDVGAGTATAPAGGRHVVRGLLDAGPRQAVVALDPAADPVDDRGQPAVGVAAVGDGGVGGAVELDDRHRPLGLARGVAGA